MALIGLTIAGIITIVTVFVLLIVILAIASYSLAQINGSKDDLDYTCKWDDSESLKALHVKLSWTISLSVIGLVLLILLVIGLIVLGVVFAPEIGAAYSADATASAMGTFSSIRM